MYSFFNLFPSLTLQQQEKNLKNPKKQTITATKKEEERQAFHSTDFHKHNK